MAKYSFLCMAIAACFMLCASKSVELTKDDIEYTLVETANGVVRGKVATTLFKQKRYYSFRGIPFAQPPLGPLRFKAPKPVESWTGVKDALEYAPACIQPLEVDPNVIIGSEDCLYLNVFVPGEGSYIIHEAFD